MFVVDGSGIATSNINFTRTITLESEGGIKGKSLVNLEG